MKSWVSPIDALLKELKSNLHDGLSSVEVAKRRARYGPNILEESEDSIISILWSQVTNILVVILFVAFALSIFLNKNIDAWFIGFTILVTIGIGFFQEYKARRVVSSLKKYISQKVNVFREGKYSVIDVSEVVPGDIIHISAGSRVPADCRILDGTELLLDESILTGESMPVEKKEGSVEEETPLSERTNCVFAGSLILRGSGRVVVFATGVQTEIGKIYTLISETSKERTPLQKSITKFSYILSTVIIAIVSLITFFGIAKGIPASEMALKAIALTVSGIPEGLPIALTIILSIGVVRLARTKAIVRHLAAAETLGQVSIFLTDKTGTLTKGFFTFSSAVSTGDLSSGSGFSVEDTKLLAHVFAENDARGALYVSPMTEAILAWGNLDGNKIVDKIVKSARTVIPFSSRYKFAVAEIEFTEKVGTLEPGKYFVVVGASDVIIDRSNNTRVEITSLHDRAGEMADRGEHVIGIGVMPAFDVDMELSLIKDLQFVGMIGFLDPIKEEAPSLVSTLEKSGIRTLVLTGDQKRTAHTVVKNFGWKLKDSDFLSGNEIAAMSDEALSTAIKYVRVYYRILPEDKLRIVSLLQKQGHVVLMCGDGVNDAPSLQKANIGIAMGSGAAVTTEVGDVVLLDNDLSLVAAALEEGKHIVANIRKAAVFLLSNSFDAMFLIGGSIAFGFALPITTPQILWVNLLTGSILGSAYALEQRTKTVGTETHFGRHHGVFDKFVTFLIVSISLSSSALLLTALWLGNNIEIDREVLHSFMFMIFALPAILACFSFKHLRRPIWQYSLGDNKVLLFFAGIGGFFTVISLYFEPLQKLLSLKPLSVTVWGIIFIYIIVQVFVFEVLKKIAARVYA
jgi:P-type Ca2+ transporter type 2C